MKHDDEYQEREVYIGPREESFTSFLHTILSSYSDLTEHHIKVLLEHGLPLYNMAFTHRTADCSVNYEYLEFLGDTTLNKAIAWYLSERFPSLNCSDGVKILTRLKINLISKKSFAMFGTQLGFWKFVSADENVRASKMAKTLEDVFEAFFGATEWLIDRYIQRGTGYFFCYTMVKALLDQCNAHSGQRGLPIISLAYKDLFDAKTRLKEIFDYFGDKLGILKYQSYHDEDGHHVTVYRVTQPQNRFRIETMEALGTAQGYIKTDAQQRASVIAIETLNAQGFIKPLPESYQAFVTE